MQSLLLLMKIERGRETDSRKTCQFRHFRDGENNPFRMPETIFDGCGSYRRPSTSDENDRLRHV
jgi:hypothetical protein